MSPRGSFPFSSASLGLGVLICKMGVLRRKEQGQDFEFIEILAYVPCPVPSLFGKNEDKDPYDLSGDDFGTSTLESAHPHLYTALPLTGHAALGKLSSALDLNSSSIKIE